ncbi:helix-turn-helix transcriptional regulator [Rathayibacter festucae]|uniref:helix-turn-helix domain-containing protein n=1 Tax=Rathayibacter festucae TaxID=110937 RepID=UPI0031346327
MTDAVSPRDLVASALRRERGRLGLSISEIARRAGIAKSTLSQLEAGEGNPSLETLWALGGALGVPFSHLVEPPRRSVQLIRAGEGRASPRRPPTTPPPCSASARRSPPRRLPPHRRARSRTELGAARPRHRRAPDPVHRTRPGRSGRRPVELAPGDCLSYPGDEPHVFDALEPGTSAVLVSEQV